MYFEVVMQLSEETGSTESGSSGRPDEVNFVLKRPLCES